MVRRLSWLLCVSLLLVCAVAAATPGASNPDSSAAVKDAGAKAKPAAAQAAPTLKPVAGAAKATPAVGAQKAAAVPAGNNLGKPAGWSLAGGKSVGNAPVKAAPGKAAPAKGMPAVAASSRAGKADPPNKAAKPALKKVDAKAGKKR